MRIPIILSSRVIRNHRSLGPLHPILLSKTWDMSPQNRLPNSDSFKITTLSKTSPRPEKASNSSNVNTLAKASKELPRITDMECLPKQQLTEILSIILRTRTIERPSNRTSDPIIMRTFLKKPIVLQNPRTHEPTIMVSTKTPPELDENFLKTAQMDIPHRTMSQFTRNRSEILSPWSERKSLRWGMAWMTLLLRMRLLVMGRGVMGQGDCRRGWRSMPHPLICSPVGSVGERLQWKG